MMSDYDELLEKHDLRATTLKTIAKETDAETKSMKRAAIPVNNLFVGEEIPLECCHFRFVEQRTILAAPQIEEIVDGIFPFVGGSIVGESRTNEHSRLLHQFATAEFLSRIEFHFL